MTTTIVTPRPETRTDTVLRSRTDDVHAVPAALRSEWIKVSTLRTNKVILGLTAGVGATIAAALAATATATGTAAAAAAAITLSGPLPNKDWPRRAITGYNLWFYAPRPDPESVRR